MPKPVGKDDVKFVVICFTVALLCFLTCLLLKGPNIFAALLMSIMTLAIGCGGLRLMHMIRDY